MSDDDEDLHATLSEEGRNMVAILAMLPAPDTVMHLAQLNAQRRLLMGIYALEEAQQEDKPPEMPFHFSEN